MKRNFQVMVECELSETVPFDYDEIRVGLKEVFSHETPIRCNGLYCEPYSWDWNEVTEADEIAAGVTFELNDSGYFDEEMSFDRHGKNGDDDIGYEIYRICDNKVVFDIGITKEFGIWAVCVERNGKDIPVACVEDMVELYKEGGESE